MNCNLDGTRLTLAELERLALDSGLFDADSLRKARAAEQKNLRGFLFEQTAKVRFDLFLAGKLKLDSSLTKRKPRVKLALDAELVGFVTRKV